MLMMGIHALARDGIPHLYCRVEAAGDDVFSIGRPGQGQDIRGMTTVDKDVTSINGIPHLYGVVTASRCDAFAIGRPGYRTYIIGVTMVGEMVRSSDEVHADVDRSMHIGQNKQDEREHGHDT